MKCFIQFICFLFISVVVNAQVDFSGALYTVESGDWSDASIWNTGVEPSESDHVIVKFGHTVYLDKMGSSSGQKVTIATNLKVEIGGVLQIGHNTDNFSKDIQLKGSLICNGVLSSGRENPGGSGNGMLYKYNSRLYFSMDAGSTIYVSGTGYLHPKNIVFTSTTGEKTVIVDHYNVVVDDHFLAKSDDRIKVVIDHFSYINVKGTIGLTGSTYQWSSNTAQSEFEISGIIVANNISLFTKNTNIGEGSVLNLKNLGVLHVHSINEGADYSSGNAGLTLNIDKGGLFKCGKEVPNPIALADIDDNLTINNQGEIRLYFTETQSTQADIVIRSNDNRPTTKEDNESLKDIFGATHIAGWYNFTDKPFLQEGLDYYEQFGSTAIKTTLSATNGKMLAAYPFNHNWPQVDRVTELLDLPEIQDLYNRDYIKTHAFWVTTKNKGKYKAGPDMDIASFLDEEEQFYLLAKRLLEDYGHLDKTFLFQNWEGDWMLRGNNKKWEDEPETIPDDVEWQVAGMSRMFRARQRGTERARNEFPNAKAKVIHGIELNKLWMNDNGDRKFVFEYNNTPCLVHDVIPHCRIDLSSWSAYDGSWSNNDYPFPSAMWQGIETINYFTNGSDQLGSGNPVQIGEFAINENSIMYSYGTRDEIRNKYDLLAAMSTELGVQQFYLWNLYCSGNQRVVLEKGIQYEPDYLYEVLDGKWVLEPDTTWGHAAEFLMEMFDSIPINDPIVDNPDTTIIKDTALVVDSIIIIDSTIIIDTTIVLDSTFVGDSLIVDSVLVIDTTVVLDTVIEYDTTYVEDTLIAGVQIKFDYVRIYPNPAKDILNIDLPNQLSKLRIYDLFGNMVYDEYHKQHSKINLIDFHSGTYIIHVQYDNENVVQKLVVQ